MNHFLYLLRHTNFTTKRTEDLLKKQMKIIASKTNLNLLHRFKNPSTTSLSTAKFTSLNLYKRDSNQSRKGRGETRMEISKESTNQRN